MVQVPAGSTYGAKRPELAAQVLGRISENHTHYNAAPPAVQNKLATVAGAWTTGTGPKAVVVAGGVQPNRSSVGSSVSHNCKAPAVPPTASLKRPYSPTKQQLDLNGKLKNVGQHGMAKVPSVDQTLLSVPVPMDCPTVIAAPASATATTSVPLLGVGHSIVSVGQVGDTMPMLAGGASNCAPVQCNAATSSIE